MTEQEMKKYKVGDLGEIFKDEYGVYATGLYMYKGMKILLTKDVTDDNPDGALHLSISAKFPIGYFILKEVRYKFMPNGIYAGQIFPPREEFVNFHDKCYHLFELK